MRQALVGLVIACGCAADPAVPAPAPGVVYLTPTEQLVRTSMALRGVRPSVADLRAVAADPARLPAIVDRYVNTPEFGATIRELHNEVLLLRVQRVDYTAPSVGSLAGYSFDDVNRSQFEEPLRLIEDVVMTDQPYSAIVTADYTMSDKIVATMWGLPHSADDAWERTPWLDGRPAAGILVSPALQLRYRSTASNFNRGRANAVARGLLCHDFLAGNIEIDPSVNLADPAAVSNAVVANPSCAGCHQTLDPLASYFWVFEQGNNPYSGLAGYPFSTYWDPTRATDWFLTSNRPPGYFGQEAPGLDGLGRAIAADPRFARCAAIHFASFLTQVDADQLPASWIATLQQGFEASGLRAKQLVKAIVLSDRFRVARSDDVATAEGIVGYQMVRPQQYARMLFDLTGFQWTGVGPDGVIDYFDDDDFGYRVLAGGIDSFFVTKPLRTMNATTTLVVRQAAELAATYAIDHGTLVAHPDATDEATVRAELAELYARIYGELDGDVDDTYRLFTQALAAKAHPRDAWIVTLTGMLSDLRAVYY